MAEGELPLPALEGTNPVGFLAALGVLACLDRAGRSPTLRWTDDLVPTALVAGVASTGDLVDVVDSDRRWWMSESVTLNWRQRPDVKVSPQELHDWALAVRSAWAVTPADPWRRADSALWSALVAEGAAAGKGDAKPTHLHFTAGQQQFLDMARTLADAVTPDLVAEAVVGPWGRKSKLKTFGWDAQGERIYALRADDPSVSKDKRVGVPGADWLAFLGLSYFPVATRGRRLRTTACTDAWKQGSFRWPLWRLPAASSSVLSLVGDSSLAGHGHAIAGKPGASRPRPDGRKLAARGVSLLLESPIRRTDQGGYGSFGAPTVLADTSALAER
ncbi:MAG: type I-G CRISPR-associated protein, Cas3-extension family [Acidimicrobiales bacterium]